MKFLSVCSGIEAASSAWRPLGWEAVAFSEIEPFPCSVLAHHYPDTPNWGDMTKYKEWPDVSIDLLCGGTPCQSFSVAGLRKGLDDPRGNLMLTFGAIAAKYRPKWLVWENVPGVLSSNGGRDFGAFLGLLGVLGYGFAYRVLDAQYFGVAQRRRRVFVVGCLGDWRSAAAVLFERHSLSGHPAPSREKGQVITPTIRAGDANGGAGHGARSGDSKDELIAPVVETVQTLRTKRPGEGGMSADHEHLVPIVSPALNTCSGSHHAPDTKAYVASVSPTLRAGGNKTGGDRPTGTDVDTCDSLIVAHSLRGEGFDASEDGTGRGTPLVPVLPFDTTQITSAANYSNPKSGDPCHPLAAGAHALAIAFPANLSGTQCASAVDIAPSMGAANPTAVAVSLRGREGGATAELGDEVGNALRASSGGGDKAHVLAATMVRRLTAEECEALQGFPRGHTRIPNWNGWRKMDKGESPEQCIAEGLEVRQNQKTGRWRVKDVDGPRYKSIGNSWAVPCARWIGERIEAVQAVNQDSERAAA